MNARKTIAVFDLEFTAWEGSLQNGWSATGEEKEVVEIGAIQLADDEGLMETGAFQALVKPVINPGLSEYFVNLTGITQARLEADGLDFADGLEAFREFIGEDTRAVYCYGRDWNVLGQDCERRGLLFPFPQDLFFNARDLMARHVNSDFAGMESNTLPDALGFPPPGVSHQAVDDCRCIAGALRFLRNKGLF
ncbi:MAG: exonuclease domain-containing protein [Rhodospirillales bacterium]|nr:exonuclease domain-containing protein [Alphaproteobacteria bacterium]MBL6947502.1 exonuclease domain-containing protein [Rhodospirillales bacterium]